MRSLSIAIAVLAVTISVASPAFAQVTLGPVVEPHGAGRVTLVWEQSDPTPQLVTLTAIDHPAVSATSLSTSGIHAAWFDGLAPGAEYTYRVGGREGRFIAPPDASQSVRFAVFGDSRTGNDIHQTVIRQIVTQRPDFFLTTGDDVESGTSIDEWRTFFSIEQPLMSLTPFSGVRGNHDVGALFENLVQLRSQTDGAGPTWGSIDLGPAHFVLIDTESPLGAGSMQYQFIDRDLAAHENQPLFAMLHRPLFSSSQHGGDPTIASALAPLFQRHGVDVVFQGHDHDYERTNAINGVTYIVTGGAGAPLYAAGRSSWTAVSESTHHFLIVEASATNIRLTATRMDGSALDQLDLDPRANNGVYTGVEPLPSTGGCGCAVPGLGVRDTSRAGFAAGAMGIAFVGVGLIRRARRQRAERDRLDGAK